MPDEIPRKLFYKLNEVCQMTDTQPYVLRFWESEFTRLAATRSPTGQRLYKRKDIDLVLQIKKLLYEDGFTIAGAREKLGMAESPGSIDTLFEAGVFAQGIYFPMVSEEKSRVRTIVMATHAPADLEEALDAFGRVGRSLGVI